MQQCRGVSMASAGDSAGRPGRGCGSSLRLAAGRLGPGTRTRAPGIMIVADSRGTHGCTCAPPGPGPLSWGPGSGGPGGLSGGGSP